MTRIAAFLLAIALASPVSAAKVLMFGGAGSTGSQVAKHLVARGDDVWVFVRPTSNKSKLDGLKVSYVVGDVMDAKTVEAAYRQVKPDYVVSSLQDRPGEPIPHGVGDANVIDGAKASGVKQFIVVSSVAAAVVDGSDADRAKLPDINFKDFHEVIHGKAVGEKALIDSGVPYTIVRIGALIVERGKPMHPGTGKAYLTDKQVMGPITYPDLGKLMADCIGAAKCVNKIFHATDDTLDAEYKNWRCRRFAKDPDKECG